MSTSCVYKEASKSGLKGYQLGRGRNAKVLYKRAEIFKWLEQQKIHQRMGSARSTRFAQLRQHPSATADRPSPRHLAPEPLPDSGKRCPRGGGASAVMFTV
ncbi:hypothetical protein ACIRED_05605, partial [Streptomyces roseolilacinus]